LGFEERSNTQTISQEYAWIQANSFLEGYAIGIKEAAEIAEQSRNSCASCGNNIAGEILELLEEREKQ